MSRGAFEGVSIVEFCFAFAGAVNSKYLADQGATVVRVESETRVDGSRSSAPHKDGKPGLNRSGSFANFNANRYSLALNLKHPRAKQVVHSLVRWADVVVENFTPGTMEELGLCYDDLKEIKPNIIMLECTIQGQTGPHRAHPGYGILAAALGGITLLTGWPDRVPSSPFAGYSDFILPRFGATALIAALDYRRRTGKGQRLDIAQYETTVQFLAPLILDYTVNGRESIRSGNLSPYACPHNAYRCKGDDRWCAIAVTSDEEWRAFCQVAGDPEWTREDRFATLRGRKQNEDEINQLVEEWTISFTAEQVMAMMQAAGVPAGVVSNAKDLLEDLQLNWRNYFWFMNHSELGRACHMGQPFLLSESQAQCRLTSPCLGEHTEYVCTKLLGMGEDEFVELFASGVFE